jgi:hypothetical protein
MPGIWLSRVVKSRHQALEGMTAMLFITPGVAENIFFAFDNEDVDAIATAAVQVNAGWRRRDDGSIVLLNRIESSTEARIGNFKGAAMECHSITVKGDVLYALVRTMLAAPAMMFWHFSSQNTLHDTLPSQFPRHQIKTVSTRSVCRCERHFFKRFSVISVLEQKVPRTYFLAKPSASGSFDDCPATPVAADFATGTDGGGAEGLDLDALGADSAGVLRRPGADDGMAAEWPSDLPGLWKGTELAPRVTVTAPPQEAHSGDAALGDFEGAHGGGGGDGVTETPVYTQITEGYAPHPVVWLDPKDPTKIIRSDIGWFDGAEEKEKPNGAGAGARVYFNRAFKYTAGEGGPGGRDRWCNSYVVRDGKLFMLSNSGPGDADAPPPACPAALDPKQLNDVVDGDVSAAGDNRADVMTANGAVSADVMIKL